MVRLANYYAFATRRTKNAARNLEQNQDPLGSDTSFLNIKQRRKMDRNVYLGKNLR